MSTHQGPLPLEKALGHQRKIEISSARLDKTHIQMRGELVDERANADGSHTVIHNMVVRVVFDSEFIITAADFVTLTAPHSDCSNFAIGPDKLIGLSLRKGFSRSVQTLYSGTTGCSHILSILIELAPASLQAYAFTVLFPDEEARMTPQSVGPTLQKMAKSLTDTCMVWAKDAPTQKRIEKGDFKYLVEKLYPNFFKRK